MASLLVIDNYDSFTFNLVQMFRMYDLSVKVFRGDKLSVRQAEILDPDYILVSPGPKNPSHAGISKPIIEAFTGKKPLLGVCLGMQCINEVFRGTTQRAPIPVHGKKSAVTHNGQGLFRGIPSPFNVARYHSLMIVPDEHQDAFQVDAFCDGQVIMGLSHRRHPLFGVQFHPESFMTEYGFKIIENFLDHGPLAGSYRTVSGWR